MLYLSPVANLINAPIVKYNSKVELGLGNFLVSMTLMS